MVRKSLKFNGSRFSVLRNRPVCFNRDQTGIYTNIGVKFDWKENEEDIRTRKDLYCKRN